MQSINGCLTSHVCRLRCTDDHIISGEGSSLRVWKKTEKVTRMSAQEDDSWTSHCILSANNSCNLKDFIILDKTGNFVTASDCKGVVYAWDIVKMLKRVKKYLFAYLSSFVSDIPVILNQILLTIVCGNL